MNRLTEIRRGLAANLANAAFEASGVSYQVQPFAQSAPTPPGFQIMPDRIDFHQELGPPSLYRFLVIGAVGLLTAPDTQELLDALLDDQEDVSDPLSVRQALEADQQLTSRMQDDGTILTGQGDACADVTVTFCSGYRIYPFQGGQQMVLGAEWLVEVRT